MLDRRDRLRIDVALIVLTVLLVLSAVLSLEGPRTGLALVVFVLLPGAAVLTLVPVRSFLSWFLLSVLLSLAVETLTSLVTLWVHAWHPVGLASVLGAVSVVLLVLDLLRARRLPSSSSRSTAAVTQS